ncbi:hypothetical protein [Niveibacterium sp. SC-1]|uniref:hypothetical protein n=1 Tax=Niveibacterium sp. SC-1 TaxID=3135646 RepID=UPI0031200689
MSAANLILAAESDGLCLALRPDGRLSVRGDRAALANWSDTLRQHKPEIVEALTQSASLASHWLLHFADHDPLEVFTTPAASHSEVLALYPEAIAAEPCKPGAIAERLLAAEDETSIRRWLVSIGENDEGAAAELLDLCRHDNAAKGYFLARSVSVCALEGAPGDRQPRCKDYRPGPISFSPQKGAAR